MRIACFANNWLGWKIVDRLSREGETIGAVVLHPPTRRRYGEEILKAAGATEGDTLDGSRLEDAEVLEALGERNPEIGISVNFGYRIGPKVLSLFPQGCFNLHTGLLPYNRGANPNVWSIVEGTPAGVTVHYMDEGLDTGDIVSQRPVPVEPTDTGESLYRKLEAAAVELFAETWPSIRSGRAQRSPQDPDAGTFHRARDLASLDCIDPSRQYKAGELINILRARTFPPYNGAYFLEQGRRVYVEVRLQSESSETCDESTQAP